MTFEELRALYNEKGATTRRKEETEAGTQYHDDPVQLGGGWQAFEQAPEIIGYEGRGEDATPIYSDAKKLGGFSRSEGGKNYFYDTSGKLFHVEKPSSTWDIIGPMVMGAMTMGGGAGALGNSLFGLTGGAAAGAGGALAGGANAALKGQNILQGALKGGLGGAGALKLGDILGTDINLGDKAVTLGDVSKAANFAKNPTLTGLLGTASKYLPNDINLGDTGLSANDVLKGVNTAQAFTSGDHRKMFDALTGFMGGSSPTNSSSTNQTAGSPTLGGDAFKPTQYAAAPVQSDTGTIQLMQDIFGTDISKAQKAGVRGYGFSGGGDIDELLQILRS